CAGCAGSWHIVASVTINSTSPCPTYAAYSFDYPKYGFVYRVDNLYTSNCVVYGLEQNSSYLIASAPVAIARSYGLGNANITAFVGKYGFKNVVVRASFAQSLITSYTTYNNVWVVNYTAPGTPAYVFAAITQKGGNLITAYTASH
ncbi:MAG: hypothetical protein KGH78_05360, partial [Candidatus Micrarchaeota archaeon]|nr:hypothetical protein [Candidatus Micrarchaeota archaeon]